MSEEDLTEGLHIRSDKKAEIDQAPTPVLAGMIKTAELIALTKTTQDRPTDPTIYAIRVHAKRLAEANDRRHREIAELRKNANKIAQWALGISIVAILASAGAALAG